MTSTKELIHILLRDFIKTNPDVDRATKVMLQSMLMSLDDESLKLLVNQKQ